MSTGSKGMKDRDAAGSMDRKVQVRGLNRDYESPAGIIITESRV